MNSRHDASAAELRTTMANPKQTKKEAAEQAAAEKEAATAEKRRAAEAEAEAEAQRKRAEKEPQRKLTALKREHSEALGTLPRCTQCRRGCGCRGRAR